jgi:hypothetical protein
MSTAIRHPDFTRLDGSNAGVWAIELIKTTMTEYAKDRIGGCEPHK